MQFTGKMSFGLVLGLGIAVGASCSLGTDEIEEIQEPSDDNEFDIDCGDDCQALRRGTAKWLIQPGSELILLAVTDDHHALYQDGQTVYATKLWPNAERRFVVDIPGDAVAFPHQVGDVVFLWTDPQLQIPSFGVSPLVVWNSASGARKLSDQSTVATIITAASEDSRQIVYTTNVSEDGLRGDLAHAYIDHPTSTSILLSDITIGLSSGSPCRPVLGFGGRGFWSFPAAKYCAGEDTTAILSTWQWGEKRDLVDGISTPLPPSLETDRTGRMFLVTLAADQTLAVVDTRGELEVIGPAIQGGEFINRFGTVVYPALAESGQNFELRVAKRNQQPTTVAPLAAIYTNLHNRLGYSKMRPSSSNGRLALFATGFNATGTTSDMLLLDIESKDAIVLEDMPVASTGNDIFTADSRYAFFAISDDVEPSMLVAHDRDGNRTQVSVPGNVVIEAFRSRGSGVSYQENFATNPNPPPNQNPLRTFHLITSDLTVANVAKPDATRRVVSSAAYINYFPSHRRHGVTFTSANEADGAGLYVAAARP